MERERNRRAVHDLATGGVIRGMRRLHGGTFTPFQFTMLDGDSAEFHARSRWARRG